MRAAYGLWGRKAITILQQDTSRSERTVRYWRAASRAPSAGDLATILRGEDGLSFLSAIMADARPAWWKLFQQQVAAIDARRLQRAAERRLQEALDARSDITDAIARADALLVGDPHFYRPHADAVRSMAGVSDRPVAPASKRGRR